MRARLLPVAGLVCLFACSEVPATSPFDPQTPAASQAKSRVFGTVALPVGFDPGEVFGELTPRLVGAEDRTVAVELVDAAQRTGAFEFTDVSSGAWRLELGGPPFRRVSVPLVVVLGQDVDLGVLELVPITADAADAVLISGRVELVGRADHGGALVELTGTPFATTTTSEGLFQLAVGADTYTLRVSAPGYQPVERPDVEALARPVEIELIQLTPIPAELRGVVTAEVPEGLVAAAGARVSVLAGAEVVAGTEADGDGRYGIPGLAPGRYTVQVELARYEAQARDVELSGGEVATVDLRLPFRAAALRGQVRRTDGTGGAGVSIIVRGDPADPVVGGIERVVLTESPDGRFRISGLLAGPYSVSAAAGDYRAVQGPRAVELVAGVDAEFNQDLVRRRWDADAPGAGAGRLAVRLDRDPDLTHVRWWFDQAEPDDVAFAPLEGDLDVALPEPDGPHTLYVQLANATAAEAPDSLFAAVSPRRELRVINDREPPQLLLARHLPELDARPGFTAANPALLEVSAFDGEAGSGVADIHIDSAEGEVVLPFFPRVPITLPAAGGHDIEVTVVDRAGNASDPALLRLTLDEQPPELLPQPDVADPAVGLWRRAEDAVTNDEDVTVFLSFRDPDGSPLQYRVHAEELAPGDWREAPDGAGPFTTQVRLRTGENGPRRLIGAVRDAAGHVVELPVVEFRLDKAVARPHRLRLRAGAVTAEDGGVVRLDPVGGAWPAQLDVEVLNFDETITAHLLGAADLEACGDLPQPPEGARRIAGGECVLRAGQGTTCTIDLDLGLQADTREDLDFLVAVTDAAGNCSELTELRVTADVAAPGEPSVRVIGGATTNQRRVTLSLDARDATAHHVAEVPDPAACAALRPETMLASAYPREVDFDLSRRDGDMLICAVFRDEAGNLAHATTTVRLDTAPPDFDAVLLRNGELLPRDADPAPKVAATDRVQLRLAVAPGQAECPNEVTCAFEQRVAFGADFPGVVFGPFRALVDVELPRVSGTYRVFVQLRDAAGNIAQPRQLGVTLAVDLDLVGPEVAHLRRDYISDRKIRLELTPPESDDLGWLRVERRLEGAATWRPLELHPAIADDVDPGSVALPCPLQQLDCAGPGQCLRPRGAPLLLLEDRAVVPGRRHFYRVRAFDSRGNGSAASAILDAGVPIAPPDIRVSGVGAGRRVEWTLPAGSRVEVAPIVWAVDVAGEPVGDPIMLPLDATSFAPGLLPPGADPVLSLVTVNEDASMRWARTASFAAQGAAAELDLVPVPVPAGMGADVRAVAAGGREHVVFRDAAGGLYYWRADLGEPELLDSGVAEGLELVVTSEGVPWVAYLAEGTHRAALGLFVQALDPLRRGKRVLLDDRTDYFIDPATAPHFGLLADGQGRVHVAWADFEGPRYTIMPDDRGIGGAPLHWCRDQDDRLTECFPSCPDADFRPGECPATPQCLVLETGLLADCPAGACPAPHTGLPGVCQPPVLCEIDEGLFEPCPPGLCPGEGVAALEPCADNGGAPYVQDIYVYEGGRGARGLKLVAGSVAPRLVIMFDQQIRVLDLEEPALPAVADVVLPGQFNSQMLDAESGPDGVVWVAWYSQALGAFYGRFGEPGVQLEGDVTNRPWRVELQRSGDRLDMFHWALRGGQLRLFARRLTAAPAAATELASRPDDGDDRGLDLALRAAGDALVVYSWDGVLTRGEIAVEAPLSDDLARRDGTPTLGGPADVDGDGVADGRDNCPDVQNQGQADTDGDGLGDACAGCRVDCGALPALEMQDFGDAYSVQVDFDGAGDALLASCGPVEIAHDRLVRFTAPEAGLWTLQAVGSDFAGYQRSGHTTLALLDDCNPVTARELACDHAQDELARVTREMAAGQTVYVALDGFVPALDPSGRRRTVSTIVAIRAEGCSAAPDLLQDGVASGRGARMEIEVSADGPPVPGLFCLEFLAEALQGRLVTMRLPVGGRWRVEATPDRPEDDLSFGAGLFRGCALDTPIGPQQCSRTLDEVFDAEPGDEIVIALPTTGPTVRWTLVAEWIGWAEADCEALRPLNALAQREGDAYVVQETLDAPAALSIACVEGGAETEAVLPFVAPTAGLWRFSVDGATALTLRDSCAAGGAQLACSAGCGPEELRAACSGGGPAFDAELLADERIYIGVHGVPGDFTLRAEPVTADAVCAGATPLEDIAQRDGDRWLWQTPGGFELAERAFCEPERNLVLRFTAPTDGEYFGSHGVGVRAECPLTRRTCGDASASARAGDTLFVDVVPRQGSYYGLERLDCSAPLTPDGDAWAATSSTATGSIAFQRDALLDGTPDRVFSFTAPNAGIWGFEVEADFEVDLYALDACDPARPGAQLLGPTSRRALAEGDTIILLVSPAIGAGAGGDFTLRASPVEAAAGCNVVGDFFAVVQFDAQQRVFVADRLDPLLGAPPQPTCSDAGGGQITWRLAAPPDLPFERWRLTLEAPFEADLDVRDACEAPLGPGQCVSNGGGAAFVDVDFSQTPNLLLSVTSLMPVSEAFVVFLEPLP